MFDTFGEFDSAEELNAAAAGQKAEGDTGALKELAEENGIDEDDVQDYMDGVTDSLCTPLTAAYGKFAVETAVLRPVEIYVNFKYKNSSKRALYSVVCVGLFC
jgi:hypothetical protein